MASSSSFLFFWCVWGWGGFFFFLGIVIGFLLLGVVDFFYCWEHHKLSYFCESRNFPLHGLPTAVIADLYISEVWWPIYKNGAY